MDYGSSSPVALDLQKQPISALNGMRGVGAVLVALYHLRYYFSSAWLVQGAYLWVDFFFIISGFVSGWHYEAALASGELSPRQFVLRRLVRLYPVYFLSLIMTFVANAGIVLLLNQQSLFSLDRLGWDFVLQLFMVQSISDLPIPWTWPTWAVSVEWLLSLLFAAVVLITRFRGRIPNAVLWASIVLNLLYLWDVAPMSLDLSISSPFFNPMMARGILSFSIGLLIYHYYPKLPKVRGAYLAIASLLLAAAAVYRINAISVPMGVDYMFPILVWPGLLILGFYPKSLASRFFSIPALTGLGIISYSIYLLHFPLSYIFNAVFPFFALAPWAIQGGVAGGVLLASLASYRWIEKPIRQWGKKVEGNL